MYIWLDKRTPSPQDCQIGLFSNQKYQFWYIFKGFGMEVFDVFPGHLVF
jgi:hypothetical protein